MKTVIAILGIICLASCKKTNEATASLNNKPVMIQIEAVYEDGKSDVSKVVLAR